MNGFAAQYKHPNWQKKRLEALNHAEFACQCCFCDDEQLHVHHKRYVKGRAIWEYELSELEVLCESCHAEAHATKDALNEVIARLPLDGFGEVLGLVIGYCGGTTGPAAVDTSDLGGERPFAESLGFVAGALASSRIGIEGIRDLEERIRKGTYA